MQYGKIVERRLEWFFNPLRLEDRVVFNPSAGLLEENGYKPVVFSEPMPVEDGYYWNFTWKENSAEIYQDWFLEELPPVELTDGEYMLKKFGLNG